MGSGKAYLKQRSSDQKNDPDTNIFTIKFSDLAQEFNNTIHVDPYYCSNCRAILNKYSKLNFIENSSEVRYVCEFCENVNKVKIDKKNIPQNDEIQYLIQSEIEENKIKNEKSVIFCIDVSGSMSTTTKISGKVGCNSENYLQEYEMLKEFIDPKDRPHYLKKLQQKQKNVSHISRKQCVITAIEQQIKMLQEKNPEKVVGLVTFNNEIVVYGDGSQQPIVLSGEQLHKEEEIKRIINQNSKQMMQNSIEKQGDTIIKRFQQLREDGQTALGPALVSALELAKVGKPGSMIIICTDGLANLGLGSLDGDSNRNFYEELGQQAAEKGIIISLVTIKGEGCKIDTLGQLVEKTNGSITRVAPEKIGQDFENIINDAVIGTQVELEVTLHKALQFRGEDNLQQQNIIKRYIGNITRTTVLSFEYQLKSIEELGKLNININQLKSIPFQIKVTYINLKGQKLIRVFTTLVQTTQNIDEAEKEAQVDVIHVRIAQKSAQLAKQGNYQEACIYNQNWDQYVQSNQHINSNHINQQKNHKYSKHNAKLSIALKNQEARCQLSQQFKETSNEKQNDNDKSINLNKQQSTPGGEDTLIFPSSKQNIKNPQSTSIKTTQEKENSIQKNNDNPEVNKETTRPTDSISSSQIWSFQNKKINENQMTKYDSNSFTKQESDFSIIKDKPNSNSESSNESDEDQDFTTLFFYGKATF
ncbi:unnamed protein product [Paramecium sonneborni]|uniref:Sec23/Sec24 trunk domain-containing protein n=1 Tax=Paramecium sonneborni TaxID=65129 RepID=A0A8S1RAR4_9CILI|nr:unnamed protein product [Paramecium sonneborni]